MLALTHIHRQQNYNATVAKQPQFLEADVCLHIFEHRKPIVSNVNVKPQKYKKHMHV